MFFLFLINFLFSNYEIRLQETAVVNDINNIMLGEFADIKCENFCKDLIFLNISSSNGYITRFNVEKALAANFKNYKIIGKVTKITQKHSAELKETLTKAISDYVLSYMKEVKIELKILNFEKEKFNNIRSFEVETANFQGISGVYFFNLKNNKNNLIKADIKIYKNVLKTKTKISINDYFNKNSFEIVNILIDKPNYVSSFQEIKNLRSNCNLEINNILSRNCLNIKPMVQRNELIKLIVRSNNVSITTSARALKDAALFDIVEVLNLFSNEKIQAKVIEENTVEVNI